MGARVVCFTGVNSYSIANTSALVIRLISNKQVPKLTALFSVLSPTGRFLFCKNIRNIDFSKYLWYYAHMTETRIELTPEAMNLAHDMGLYESEVRGKGYAAERIAFLRGRKFGPRVASLAMRDSTAPLIYLSEVEAQISEEPVLQAAPETPTPLATWAQKTYANNVETSGIGGVRDRAFKD